MAEEMVIYDGRPVPKRFFRAFVYGPNDTQKLANSWEQYEELISSGIWYPKKSDTVKPVETRKELIVEKVDYKKGGK